MWIVALSMHQEVNPKAPLDISYKPSKTSCQPFCSLPNPSTRDIPVSSGSRAMFSLLVRADLALIRGIGEPTASATHRDFCFIGRSSMAILCGFIFFLLFTFRVACNLSPGVALFGALLQMYHDEYNMVLLVGIFLV